MSVIASASVAADELHDALDGQADDHDALDGQADDHAAEDLEALDHEADDQQASSFAVLSESVASRTPAPVPLLVPSVPPRSCRVLSIVSASSQAPMRRSFR